MSEVNKQVHVVINPASGQDQYILNTINRVFHEQQVAWDVSITQKSGDAARFSRQAIADGADVVCAYGGDGTVMEVAEGVAGSRTPMAILPGGTANLMSVELGIPKDLAGAAKTAVDPSSVVRQVDMGQIGEKRFILRVGIGFAGEKVKMADREMKDKWGIMAYSIAGLKALKTVPVARYRITVDGAEHEIDGKTCLIDNAGNIGLQGVSIGKSISVSDGLLDVIVVRDASIGSWIAVGDQILGREPNPDAIKHWQGREISIECDPPQTVQVDGEIWDPTPLTARVVPGVLSILTPSREAEEE
jgi:YegS/Rv2252/BmrU family lipid kinase